MTLVGVPGIGKSRLVAELFARRRRRPGADLLAPGPLAALRRGRHVWALGEIVKAQAGILETDAAEAAERSWPRRWPTLVRDEERTGSSGTCARSSGSAGAARRRPARRGVRRLAAASSRRWPSSVRSCSSSRICTGPTTACSTSSTTSSTGRAACRCSCLHRPAGAARAAAGLGRRQARTRSRSRSRRSRDAETARLVGALLDQALLPAETAGRRCSSAPAATRCTPRSTCGCCDGLLAERRLAARRDELPLPETVQGIIAARLDALAAEEKALLQDAAVVGKVFWRARSRRSAAARGEARGAAARARAQGVRPPRAPLGGRRRDASTPSAMCSCATSPTGRSREPRRADKHRRAAEWIESLAKDRADDRAEMLAHHYVTALDLTRRPAGDRRPRAAGPARPARGRRPRLCTERSRRRDDVLPSRARALARRRPGLPTIAGEARACPQLES